MIRYFTDRFWILYYIFRFKMKGIPHGGKLRICGRMGLTITKGAKFEVGYNFLVFSGNMFNPMGRNIRSFIKVGERGTLTIGDKVGMSSAVIWCEDNIKIGNNTKIGAMAIVTDTDAHSLNPIYRLDSKEDKAHRSNLPVTIGSNVLIGANSIVLKGVTIGDNTVIGAGSVVTKDIPANVIAAGNPCKVIREL